MDKTFLFSRQTGSFLLFVVMFLLQGHTLTLIPFQEEQKNNKKPFVIVIDPGHGGTDPGVLTLTPSKYKHEKDLNLMISRKLTGYLRNKLENIKVVMTRNDDSYLSLEQRVKIANDTDADLFLSIHCNSNPLRMIKGTQVHVHTDAFKKSIHLAEYLDEQFEERAKRKSKGILNLKDRGHNLYVLQYTKMPSVLVEAGFISNPEEERYLNSKYGQVIMASAIFRAVRSYKKRYGK